MEARITHSHRECPAAPAADQNFGADSKPLTGKVEEAGVLLAQVVEELTAGGKRLNGGIAVYERERVLELVGSLRHALNLLKLN